MSSSMAKLLWSKFKSPFSKTGRSENEDETNKKRRNPNVNEEYKEAFRTTSYVEMWSRIQGQLRRRSIDEALESLPSTSSSSTLPNYYVHLSDYLFQPEHKATLTGMVHNMDFHRLLIDYFESSLEACNLCDLLLRRIHQTRVNYRRIENVIKLTKSAKHSSDHTKKMRGSILRELSAYASLRNPLLSFVSQTEFRDLHDNNLDLLNRLNSEQRKIRRKAKLKRIWKRIGGYCLVVAHTALLITLLVIALHGFIGIVVAPGLLSSSLCFLKRRKTKKKNGELDKLCAQLDIAAKGTYILVNDFDTVSRLVESLSDDLEHKKALAEMCVRHKNVELLKEVVKELYMHDSCYQEQLDELEEHVYLCFHTINRSRRLVLRELMATKQK